MESTSGKTKVYEITTKDSSSILGYIKWHGAWRKYCFYPEGNTIFDSKCLEAISICLLDLTNQHQLKNIVKRI